jgi:hypothetical protein
MLSKCTPLLLILLCSFSEKSQAASDNQVWSSAAVRYTTTQGLKLGVVQHLRLDQNASSVLSIMPALEASISPHKQMEIGTGYRFIKKRSKSGDFETSHRIDVNAEIEKSAGRLTGSYRIRGQSRYKMDENEFDNSLRNRLTLSLDTDSQFTPFVASESFSDSADEGLEHRSVRSSLGTAIRLDKSHRLKLRFHYEIALDGSGDVERILALGYQYRRKQKKESASTQ